MSLRAGAVLKALRSRWMTAEELAAETGADVKTVRRVLASDLIPHGVVEARERSRQGRQGYKPKEFSLTEEWRRS